MVRTPPTQRNPTNHVALPIESLDTCKELLVVAAENEDLSVLLDGLGQNLHWAGVELLLLLLLQLLQAHFGFRTCPGKAKQGRMLELRNLAFSLTIEYFQEHACFSRRERKVSGGFWSCLAMCPRKTSKRENVHV